MPDRELAAHVTTVPTHFSKNAEAALATAQGAA